MYFIIPYWAEPCQRASVNGLLACTVASNFGVHIQASEHTQDAHHKLTFRLPHYICGVATGTVAVSNEIQLFCSCLASFHVVISIT